ncbi:hypothetical protein COT20_01080 [bacterium (Candidatus Gribaldobacteria) CG08_land_8_20_14_0_20_39_15]|uniref:Uncharacterized protein n=1 Tax=bacterium (Candidatus Gribaldobacteria) CG08_land_8_20_14_0_20_39_15 TaxID=2014273 RepID=A0A2M6XUZ9_9BACT|nr:MAG: hypothetical protein COT20_01080 [bacterium (Candidatus Gribaldobacteria) CG08_land_8_20_14_0_20_39_15]
MAKNIAIVVLVVALICATGFASYREGYSKGLETQISQFSIPSETGLAEDGGDEIPELTIVDLRGDEVLRVLQETRAKDYIERQDNKYKIVLRGEVTEISGRVLTLSRKYDPLTHGNDPLSLYINEEAQISVAIEKIAEYQQSMRTGKFEEIEIDNLVSISAELEPDKPLKVLIVWVYQGSLKPSR